MRICVKEKCFAFASLVFGSFVIVFKTGIGFKEMAEPFECIMKHIEG
jgi:hypothetical protein